ncbi:MAG: hypothetical protein EXR79_12340 [Myxococcales bacterium]|nr:hypothetical protein [Myxococcales bacterium]
MMTLRSSAATTGLALLASVAASTAAYAASGDRRVWLAADAMAVPDGALALSTNPAGLVGPAAFDLRLFGSGGGARVGPTRGAGWGAFLSVPAGPVALAVGVEHLADRESDGQTPAVLSVARASAGLGLGLGERASLGGAYVVQTHAGGVQTRTGDLGLLLRPWSWLSLAARVRQLHAEDPEASAAGRALTTRWGVGAGVRPFGHDRVTAAVDLEWPVDGGLGAIGAWLEARVIDGLFLRATLQDVRNGDAPAGDERERRIGLAARIDFGRVGAEIAARQDRNAVQGKAAAALALRISGDTATPIVERGPRAVRLKLTGAVSEGFDGPGLHLGALLGDLRALEAVRGIDVIVLDVSQFQADWAQVEELREAIARLRRAGKKVLWHADALGTRALALAAACDRIVVAPGGVVSAHGVGADFIGLKEALARVGVAFQSVQFRDHKTAGDALTRTTPSPELEGQLRHLVARRWAQFTTAVALGRDVSPGDIEVALTQGIAFPQDAVAARLIDAVVAPHELEATLRQWQWLGSEESVADRSTPVLRRTQWGPRARIDIVTIDGAIGDHKTGRGPLGRTVGGAEIADLVDRSAKDPATRALVVRIASPGGTLYGSEAMRSALEHARTAKPVVASMAGVAASGGYWTSLGADPVLADRATVTGSIGVIALKPNVAALAERLGLGIVHVGQGPGSAVDSVTRPWSPDELALLERVMGRFYGMFLERTAARRKVARDQIEVLAGGRIWLGDEAAAHGLVDRVGGLADAIDEAKRATDLDSAPEAPLLRWLPEASWLDRAKEAVGLGASAPLAGWDALQAAAGPWLDAAWLLSLAASEAPLALLPVAVEDRGP